MDFLKVEHLFIDLVKNTTNICKKDKDPFKLTHVGYKKLFPGGPKIRLLIDHCISQKALVDTLFKDGFLLIYNK